MVVELIVERCAALDVHKDTVMACARKPGPSGGKRVNEVARSAPGHRRCGEDH